MADEEQELEAGNVTEETSVTAGGNYVEAWQAKVGAFATAVGKPIEAISTALATVCGEPSDAALAVLADEESSPYNDIKEALASLKIPTGVLRKNVILLRAPKAAPVVAGVSSTQGYAMILPTLLDETSFVSSLKVGGQPIVSDTDVISAIRAGLANRVGLYQLPKAILKAMWDFAASRNQLVGASYYALKKEIARSSYADILAALNIPGDAVNEGSKKDLMEKVDAIMWQELAAFHGLVKDWYESWTSSVNPMMALSAMAAGQVGGAMPPMMQAPDTMMLRQSVDGFIEKMNQIFSPGGMPVARALAADASRITLLLNDPTLYTTLGKADKEEMLKDLGANVTADYVTMEQSLARFALSVLHLKDAAVETELLYLSAMYQLGNSIPWFKLTNDTASPPTVYRDGSLQGRRIGR